MILNDTGFSKIVYEQTGAASLSGAVSFDSDTAFRFGVSGTGGTNHILFSGTKYYDDYDRLLGSYALENTVYFKYNFNQTHYSLYVNNVPVVLGQHKKNPGSTTAFFVDSQNQSDFIYQFEGEKPDYFITDLVKFVTGAESVTGYIRNDGSYPIIIHSGSGASDEYFDLEFPVGQIAPGDSGAIVAYPKDEAAVELYSVPFTLNTNFGNILTGIKLSGYELPVPNYSIEIFGNPSIIDGTNENFYVKLNSLSGDFLATVFLTSISGTGDVTSNTLFQGYATGLASGYITESGTLTYTAVVNSTGDGHVKNTLLSGHVIKYAHGGPFAKTFLVPATGYATGANYSGIATGYITYNTFGILLDTPTNRGKFLVSGIVVNTASQIYNLNPAYITQATGAIYYNIPEDDFTSDILYVNTMYHGIVFGFHYNSFSGLINYLNSNTGIHRVTATSGGPNTINLQGLYGSQGNSTLLHIDQDNDGDMSVSGPFLYGGAESGYGIPLASSTPFTGLALGYITGSGNFTAPFSGIMSGYDDYTVTTRQFTDNWNLLTGVKANATYSFKDTNSFVSGLGYYNGYGLKKNFFAIVTYDTFYPGITDVARLMVSGLGNATGVTAFIDITGLS